jgi:ferredoxin, 2Fe-2S
MPKVSFTSQKKRADFEVSTGDNLMKALLNHGHPVASSCLGEGVCSKCRIEILSGANNLSAETQLEIDLKARNKIDRNCRISCQTHILGDIKIDTPYW